MMSFGVVPGMRGANKIHVVYGGKRYIFRIRSAAGNEGNIHPVDVSMLPVIGNGLPFPDLPPLIETIALVLIISRALPATQWYNKNKAVQYNNAEH